MTRIKIKIVRENGLAFFWCLGSPFPTCAAGLSDAEVEAMQKIIDQLEYYQSENQSYNIGWLPTPNWLFINPASIDRIRK